MRWAKRSRDAFAGRGRPVRHPAGRARRGAAPGLGRGADRDRLRRLCGRRPRGGRGAGGDVRLPRFRLPGQLPEDRPRYLMGVGKPDDIVGAVERGIDMFDCVLPTRSGRTGQAFTRDGPINIRNAKFAEDQAPLDPESPIGRLVEGLSPPPRPLGRDLGRDADDRAQSLVLPAADAGAARRDRRRAAGRLCGRLPGALLSLTSVIPAKAGISFP